MRFMFFSEGETLPGASYQNRYWELVEQVIHAEKWGFDSFGVSEQQFYFLWRLRERSEDELKLALKNAGELFERVRRELDEHSEITAFPAGPWHAGLEPFPAKPPGPPEPPRRPSPAA